MQELKETFLKAISDNPDLLNYKWSELERKFSIPSTGRPGDRVRRWWRNYEKPVETTYFIAEAPVENTVEEGPAGAKLKSVWQVQGKGGEIKTLRSYAIVGESEEETRTKLIEDIAKFSPRIKLTKNTSFEGENLLEIAIPDFHIGRADIESSKTLFRAALTDLIYEALDSYKIDRIVFPVGNDWLNTDNIEYSTTKKTPQFDVNPWYETFRYGWEILAEGITLASTVAPVDVIVVQGNHDKTRMFYIGDVLMAYFRNNENVTVDNSMQPFKYYRFGQILIMYEHGELKPMDYPLIMADSRKQDWADTTYREVHLGHFHKEMTMDEYRGVKIRFLPSLSPESDWEKERGYGHLKQAQGLVWNKDRGLRSILYYNG